MIYNLVFHLKNKLKNVVKQLQIIQNYHIPFEVVSEICLFQIP